MDTRTAPNKPTDRALRARRALRKKRAERGVALLLVLTSIALLFVMAEQTRDEVEVAYAAAAVSRDQVISHYEAKSGINLARLLLHAEPAIRRAIMVTLGPMMALFGGPPGQIPVWEQGDLLFDAFRASEGTRSLSETFGVNGDRAKNLGGLRGAQPILIVDEDAKINVNGSNRGGEVARREAARLVGLTANPALEPFFTQRDSDGQFTDRPTLLREVIDYTDQDATLFDIGQLLSNNVNGPGAGAPEDNFYSTLHPSYTRRNAPFDSINELRLVRGLGDDDLWQRIVDPDPSNPRRRTLTVWGSGKVNVNTANAQTLLAVLCAFGPTNAFCTNPEAARKFIGGLSMVQGFTVSMGLPIFGSTQMFLQTLRGQGMLGQLFRTFAGDQPVEIRDPGALENSISVESKVFSVVTASRVGLAYTRIHAVIDMRPQPSIDSAFLRVTTGGSDIPPPPPPPQSTSGSGPAPFVQGPAGSVQAVDERGGTIIYWHED